MVLFYDILLPKMEIINTLGVIEIVGKCDWGASDGAEIECTSAPWKKGIICCFSDGIEHVRGSILLNALPCCEFFVPAH